MLSEDSLELPLVSPTNFFSFSWDCPEMCGNSWNPKHQLPDLSIMHQEKSFADVSLGWSLEGLYFKVRFSIPYGVPVFPSIEKGDSIELWIDTRDLKTAGLATRFCHHFYFLPISVEGHIAGEITRFRTEDTHDLCDSNLLEIKLEAASTFRIFIPSECLFGYDPLNINRIGFTYRINRAGAAPQHFVVDSNEFDIGQQPSLWATIKFASKRG